MSTSCDIDSPHAHAHAKAEMPHGIVIKRAVDTPVAELLPLYLDAGWIENENDIGWIEKSAKGCFSFYGAFYGDRIVGMAKALSDGVSSAYIHEVTVLKEFRGKKIGQRVVEAVIADCESKGIDWIRLVCDTELIKFYSEIDFAVSNEHVMVIRGA